MKALSINGMRMALAGAVVALLAACTSAPVQTYPDVTWRHLDPIVFAAGPIEKVAAYPAGGDNNLESYLPFSLGKMAMNWPDDRIQTAGTSDVLRYSVTEASITSSVLKTKKGFSGVFTDDQSEKVEMKVSAKLEVLDPNGTQKGEVAATAVRTRTLSESMSVAEREKAVYDETATLLMDLDRELERQINNNLGRFLLQ
ncbi:MULTISPECIES: hypothetical protein [Thalassospira]|jgi:hypothetical protein|uniref:Lipoprotein n=1 Tax=Thalassospira xiamenensis TaxID=220697 RepID=A0ABR5XYU4_9PROT|nr:MULTISPECIES: hypothetical protein [Thalassospira]KZD01302.1 hypothetical protein AUP40_20610 [Thalassospira xiamenensis]KZD11406.1 hypothetical protein AUP45_06825 [Thalassospira xiamenensis]MAB31765.1 hypothetical protein [Thalassospira sp.]MAL27976.1 hypothetical protein [Thalassospira sp.]MBA06719.1 hypothetical protein [Thalassospira sp.]|tara:strand:+ start:1035 stop:1631 length:597 start_codon:yes stop_codon:yes gene_type:complete